MNSISKMRCSLTAALLLLFGCSQPADAPVDEKAEIVAVKQILTGYNDDIRAHGLLAEFAYLDSSDQFFWVPPGYNFAMGYDTIAKIIRANAAGIKQIDNRWDTLAIHLTSPTTAAYTGKMNSNITDTGGKVFNTILIETGTLIKRSNGWKILCGQTAVIK